MKAIIFWNTPRLRRVALFSAAALSLMLLTNILYFKSMPPVVLNGLRSDECPAHSPFTHSGSPNVAIVGAAGYVGSALHHHLREQGYANVRGFDRNPRAAKFEQVVQCPIRVLDDRSLAKFDVVVYLGGLTGRKECEVRTRDEVEEENVQDILRLAKRMTNNQLLVFASTSATAEGSGA